MTRTPKPKLRIAINGIGVAGPTLAYWLKKYGFEPVLFEREPQLRQGGYVIDFWGLGYEIAERMGILPQLKKLGYSVSRMRMVGSRGETVAKLDAAAMLEATNERILSIARSDLAAAIFDACPDVETRFGTHIINVEQEAEYAVVELNDGTKEKFDLVIGADGLHSHIRACVFGPASDYEISMGASVAAFRLKDYQPREELVYVSHIMAGRQIARFSMRDDETLFLFVFRTELMQSIPQNEAQEKTMLRTLFADSGWEANTILQRMEEVSDIYFDNVSQIKMPEWTKGRVALVGDSAACASLLAGEGTGLAMTEAYVLAGELYRANGDHIVAFAQYHKKLAAFLAGKQKSAAAMVGFFAPKNKFQAALYRLVIKSSAIPFIGNAIIRRTMHDDFILPDYQNKT